MLVTFIFNGARLQIIGVDVKNIPTETGSFNNNTNSNKLILRNILKITAINTITLN